jgi:hypothetical protein
MNLNSQIDIASKFATAPQGVPVKDQSEQMRVGLDWAKRLESQPPPEPIKVLTPIVPVAN